MDEVNETKPEIVIDISIDPDIRMQSISDSVINNLDKILKDSCIYIEEDVLKRTDEKYTVRGNIKVFKSEKFK